MSSVCYQYCGVHLLPVNLFQVETAHVNSEGGQVKGPTVVSVVSGQLCATVARITCMVGEP